MGITEITLRLAFCSSSYYSRYNYSKGTGMSPGPRPATEPATPSLGDLRFHILLALGDGPAHGYAIGKDIEARSQGRLDATTGALYQALKRLLADGLIEPVAEPPEPSADARRKYFALTRAGRRAVAAEAEWLESLVRAARRKRLYPASA
jgi:DNA-binding PadR family transcriptional regulator